MDIIENTLQSELTASITHNKNDLNDAILSITPEKSVYQKFEPSISEIKEIKLEKNNILEYVANKSENPCNLILTRVLSRSAVSLPKCTTGILTKARSFLSYIIINKNSDSEIVKVIHLESMEYTILKSVDGRVVSISLNDHDLLAVLYDSLLMNIYKIKFIDNKVVCNIVCSRSFENFSKERLNLTWNNPGQDEKSIIIWAKDSVLTVDIKITENEYEIHNDNAIESFKNVLTACMSSSSLFIAVASENNNVTVCHRINSNSKYENYLFTTENMTNEQIISLKLIERDIQTLIPSTLIILTANHIVFYDLFDPYDKIRISFLIPCSITPSVNFIYDFLPLIDSINKILILIKLKISESSIRPTKLLCYPFRSKTLSFASNTFSEHSGSLLLYHYHDRGMQTHKVSTQTDPLTKHSIFKEPLISCIEHSKPTEQNGAESSESAPQLNTKTAPKLVHIEYVSEFESGDIYEYDSSQSSSLDASIIIAEENNQNNSNPIGPEILNNIVHLKKYIHQSIDTLNIKLCNHITEEIDTLQQPFDKRTSYLTKQLADIENCMRVLEENQKQLLSSIQQPQSTDTITPLRTIQKSLNSFNNKLDVNSIQNILEKQIENSFEKVFKNQTIMTHLTSSVSTILKTKLEERILSIFKQEFQIHLKTIHNVFETATQNYLASVGKHMDNLLSSKIHILNVNQQSSEKFLDEIDSKICNIMHKNMDLIYEKLQSTLSTSLKDFVQQLALVNGNSDKIVEDNTLKSFHILIVNKKFAEAFKCSIQSKKTIMLKLLLESTSPRELFNQKNNIPLTLIKDFIKLVAEDLDEIDHDLLYNHVAEALIAVKVSAKPCDNDFILILKKLQNKLQNISNSGISDPSIILMIFRIIESVF